jgi:hypothetical protein
MCNCLLITLFGVLKMNNDKTKEKRIQSEAKPDLLSANENRAIPEKDTTSARCEKERWFWKLYEKTLKVIVDAVLDRMWTKPQ